jgi:HEPN domain-containing protein
MLANLRIREAQVLFRTREYSGAYYLAGYSIECALKACIAKKFMKHEFPDRKTVLESYTHDLIKLAKLAGLESELEGDTDQSLKKNWDLARGWSEESRYRVIEQPASKEMINAIIQRVHGVLPCIKRRW